MEGRPAVPSCGGGMWAADLSEDYKRFVFALFYVDMYQFCFYFSLFVFKIGIMEMLFNNSIIFRNTVFFDVLIVYLWALAVKEMGTVEYIQLQTSAERVVIMLISRAILIGMVIWIVNCKTVGRSVFIKYRKLFIVFVLLEYIGLLYCDQLFLFNIVDNRVINIYFVFFPLLLLFGIVWIVNLILYFEKRMR